MIVTTCTRTGLMRHLIENQLNLNSAYRAMALSFGINFKLADEKQT